MALTIRSTEEHRLDREAGAIVYPVISRRAQGLSVGINLFPDQKRCSFDCPYCEVFPFQTDILFSLAAMERGLREWAAALNTDGSQKRRSGPLLSALDTTAHQNVKDLSFSGNGEPTLHPAFRPALELAGRLRNELFPKAKLVLITNGTGLLEPETAEFLASAARGEAADFQGPGKGLEIWLKIDAGTEDWYKKINRSAIPFQALNEALSAFALRAPFIIQTMICKIDGALPPDQEVAAWEAKVRSLAEAAQTAAFPPMYKGEPDSHYGIQAVQLYGKARSAPEDPVTEPAAEAYLIERRNSLARTLAPHCIPIEVFP